MLTTMSEQINHFKDAVILERLIGSVVEDLFNNRRGVGVYYISDLFLFRGSQRSGDASYIAKGQMPDR